MKKSLYIFIFVLLVAAIAWYIVRQDPEREEVIIAPITGVDLTGQDPDQFISNRVIDKVVETNNRNTTTGIEWFKQLNFQNAREYFVDAGSDPAALYYLGLIASYEDNDSLAKSYFKKLLGDSDASESLKTDTKEILDAYSIYEAYEGSPRDFLYALLGKAYVNAGQATLGILKLKQATTLNPNYNDAWILLGTAYILAENYVGAEYALRKVSHDDPRPEPSYYLGLGVFNQGRYEDSIVIYREALKKSYQPAADVYTRIGESFLAMGRNDEAFSSYMDAIESEPSNPERYVKPIHMQLNVFDNTKAAANLAYGALQQNIRSALANNLVGWVEVEIGNLGEAKRYLDTAISLDPTLSVAYFNYGKYFEKVGDRRAAKIQYEKVITLDPESSIAKEASASLERLGF